MERRDTGERAKRPGKLGLVNVQIVLGTAASAVRRHVVLLHHLASSAHEVLGLEGRDEALHVANERELDGLLVVWV